MSDELVRIANALERIADAYDKKLHIEVDHAHIDDIGEIHGDVVTPVSYTHLTLPTTPYV